MLNSKLTKHSLSSLILLRAEYLGIQSLRFKKIRKIWLGSKLLLGLIYCLSFWIQNASYFPQSWVQKNSLIFYLADFHGRNWCIPSFYENKTQHMNLILHWNQPRSVLFSLGLTPWVEPKILQLSITWHKLSSELGQRLGIKSGLRNYGLSWSF